MKRSGTHGYPRRIESSRVSGDTPKPQRGFIPQPRVARVRGLPWVPFPKNESTPTGLAHSTFHVEQSRHQKDRTMPWINQEWPHSSTAVRDSNPSDLGDSQNPEKPLDLDGNRMVRIWRDSNRSTRSFYTIFALFWNLFVLLAFALASQSTHIRIKRVGTFSSLREAYENYPQMAGILIFPLIGFIFMYVAATIWMNRTDILIDRDDLLVRRGPLPWRHRRAKIYLGNVLGMQIEEYSCGTLNGEPQLCYLLKAESTSGEVEVIERGMESREDARVLEQWIRHQAARQGHRITGATTN